MKKQIAISIVLILAFVLAFTACANKKVESIEIVSGTAPTEVYVDEQPDFSNMKLLVKYNDGTSIEILASEAKIGAIDTSKPGRVSYSIEYDGFSATASITVKAKSSGSVDTTEVTLESITYLSGLNTNLFVGGELDTTVLKVMASYSDGSTRTIESKDLTTNIAEFDKFAVGDQTLVITYEGKTCSVTISVKAVVVSDFTIDYSTVDTSKTYYVGDTVDTSKIVGKATYNNGTTEDLVNSDFAFSAIDNTTAGEKTLAITYEGITKTLKFTFVAVAPSSLTLASGTIPNVVYGDTPDTSAINAVLKYNNGNTEDVANAALSFSSVDTSTPGNKTVAVSYNGLSFNVEFTVVDISSVQVIGINSEVKIGTDDIDCSKVQLLLTLSDGKTKYVTDGVSVDKSAFSSAELGKTSVTVNYKNESVNFEIDVVEILGDPTLSSIEVTGGLVDSIFEGQTFSAEGITLLARFSDNQILALDYSDVIITGTVGDQVGNHTLTISYTYDGVTKTCTYTVEVVEVKVTRFVVNLDEVRVERNPNGVQPDLSALTAIAYYNNGTQKTLALSDLTVDTVDVLTTGERTLTVTYEEGTDTVKVIVVEPTIVDVKVKGTYANSYIVGEAYDLSGVKAEVHYSNGEIITKDGSEATVTFDDVTGVLTVTFGGESASANITRLTVISVAINTESFKTAPFVNEFSTEGLELIATLSDGSTVRRYVSNGVTIDATNVNPAMLGSYYITAAYMGITSPKVVIQVIYPDDYKITGVAYPEGVALWKDNTLQSNFLDKGYNYAVGDDNPFKFELLLVFRHKETNEIINKYIAYKGVSKVYDMSGNEVGSDIVVIDDVNHTFKFTEAAVGNSYRIATRPESIPDGTEALFTKELTVEIVDGFNIHDEIELNVLTNNSVTIGNTSYDQRVVAYNFMKNNVDFARNMSQEQYFAFVNGINGIVIHDFMQLETTDFPDEYFFIAPDGTKYLWDHFALYYHVSTKKGTFNFYGNYFQIETNAIPCVAPPTTFDRNGVETNNEAADPTSNSEIFRFHVLESILSAATAEGATYNHTDYKTNFYAISMSDNDRSIAEQTEAERVRSTLGAYAFKLAKGEYNFNSVNIQRYYISVMNEYDCLTVNYDYCTFYDSWNNHISVWGANTIDEYDDKSNVSIHAGHQPIHINITNSFIAKCGGPVIMSSNADPTEPYNAQSGPQIVVDDKSVIYSYVAGTESWFINYQATSVADNIKLINNFFLPNGAQFTTKIGDSTTDFMNMIYLNLSSAGLNGLDDDIDGSFTIGGKALVEMNDTSIYLHPVTGAPTQGNYGQAYVDTVMTGAKLSGAEMLPPIFMSSEGGFTYFNGTTLEAPMGPAFSGNMLTLYYNNMGVLLGYNESAISAEPSQRDNTTITRVTAPHGYN